MSKMTKNKRILSAAIMAGLSLQSVLPLSALADTKKNSTVSEAESVKSDTTTSSAATIKTATKNEESSSSTSSTAYGTTSTSSSKESSKESNLDQISSSSASTGNASSASSSIASSTDANSDSNSADSTSDKTDADSSSKKDDTKKDDSKKDDTKKDDSKTQTAEQKQVAKAKSDLTSLVKGNKYLDKDQIASAMKLIDKVTDLKGAKKLAKSLRAQIATIETLTKTQTAGVAGLAKLGYLTDSQVSYYTSAIQEAKTVRDVNHLTFLAKKANKQQKVDQKAQKEAQSKAQKAVDNATHWSNPVNYPKSSTAGTSNSSSDTNDNDYVDNGELNYTENSTTDEFINKIGDTARKLGKKNNLYASVMIAQAILESGSGNSALAKAPNYNLFGIKGAYKGHSVNFSTNEDNGSGSMYSINAGFRKYPGYKESLQDYVNLLKGGTAGNSHFYSKTWKSNTDSYKDATSFLQGHYATSTTYAQALNGLIKTYDLTDYDHPETNLSKISNRQKAVLKEANKYVGVPYVFGGTQTTGFDCSGYIQYIMAKVHINLPRTAQAQYDASKHIAKSDLRVGDLVFFKNTYACADYITHVGMYIGNGKYIQEGGDAVHTTPLSEAWTQAHLAGFGRVMSK